MLFGWIDPLTIKTVTEFTEEYFCNLFCCPLLSYRCSDINTSSSTQCWFHGENLFTWQQILLYLLCVLWTHSPSVRVNTRWVSSWESEQQFPLFVEGSGFGSKRGGRLTVSQLWITEGLCNGSWGSDTAWRMARWQQKQRLWMSEKSFVTGNKPAGIYSCRLSHSLHVLVSYVQS